MENENFEHKPALLIPHFGLQGIQSKCAKGMQDLEFQLKFEK